MVFFELRVPSGTLGAPSVREGMLRIVKCLWAWVAHVTSLCAKAQYFTVAQPLLHLAKPNLTATIMFAKNEKYLLVQ